MNKEQVDKIRALAERTLELSHPCGPGEDNKWQRDNDRGDSYERIIVDAEGYGLCSVYTSELEEEVELGNSVADHIVSCCPSVIVELFEYYDDKVDRMREVIREMIGEIVKHNNSASQVTSDAMLEYFRKFAWPEGDALGIGLPTWTE